MAVVCGAEALKNVKPAPAKTEEPKKEAAPAPAPAPTKTDAKKGAKR